MHEEVVARLGLLLAFVRKVGDLDVELGGKCHTEDGEYQEGENAANLDGHGGSAGLGVEEYCNPTVMEGAGGGGG